MSYSVLFVDGWDEEQDEPVGGGRCIEEVASLSEAFAALRDWMFAARRAWGKGLLVVTDPAGHRVVDERWSLAHQEAQRGRGGVGAA